MTLLEFEELTGYWAHHPPVHLMVAAYLGVKPAAQGGPRAAAPTAEPFQLPPGFGIANRDLHAGCTEAPIFDFAQAKARERERFSAPR